MLQYAPIVSYLGIGVLDLVLTVSQTVDLHQGYDLEDLLIIHRLSQIF